MNAGAKLGAYGLVLVAVLGGGAAIGAVAGPIDVGGAPDHGAEHGSGQPEPTGEPDLLPAGGLLVSQDGYTLSPTDRLADEGPFTFTIDGPDGRPVTRYDEVHDRELHLVVASRDLGQFLHLHPVRDGDGVWSIDLPTLPAGGYRAFAEFRATGGPSMTLGIDVLVPGDVASPSPLQRTTTTTVDGFEVELDGDLVPGEDSEIVVTVKLDGTVVETEPYLGAAGHLVALRDGDLAHLHVHPIAADDAQVRFLIDVPSAGTYAMFFDFLHEGEVHNAHFVVDAHPSTDHQDG